MHISIKMRLSPKYYMCMNKYHTFQEQKYFVERNQIENWLEADIKKKSMLM